MYSFEQVEVKVNLPRVEESEREVVPVSTHYIYRVPRSEEKTGVVTHFMSGTDKASDYTGSFKKGIPERNGGDVRTHPESRDTDQ